jgi:hypothetical protein
MKIFYSIFIGVVLGIGSIFLHLVLAPVGFIFALISSVVGIWAIGRIWGKRYLKALAGLVWLLIIMRAGTPGISNEILIQGNVLGNALINFGFLTIIGVVALPI